MPIWNRLLLPEGFAGPHPFFPSFDIDETAGGSADADTDDAEEEQEKPAASEESEDWKGRARTWEQRAKNDARELQRLRKQLDDARKASMSEAEKAIEDARAEGEKKGRSQASGLLVQARLEAALAHVDDEARDALIDGVNAAKFMTDDGTPDTDAIKAWAEKVAPKTRQVVDLGQGRRTAGKPTDMNSIIRRAAGV